MAEHTTVGAKAALVREEPSVQSEYAYAVFASSIEPGDGLSVAELEELVLATLSARGASGCAACAAREFGDHPEAAVARMRWALVVAGALVGGPPMGVA